jgi:hypothetical protein
MITVKVKNPLWDRRASFAYPISEFNYYTGEVVPNPRWCTDDQFCLATGDTQFPFRVLDKDDVIGMARKKKTDTRVRTVSIAGTKPGQNYLVTIDGKNSSCTCVGFGYRRDCKHIRMAVAA